MSQERTTKQILNMTIAAFGIQFGSALQMANMSSIYKYLGADVDHMAFLWLAAPITGLLAQPIIGFMSDRTWKKFLPGRFGRRQPYVLLYAFLAFISLVLMPNSGTLIMAASLLWMLDLANNGATEPFRAMLGDLTTEKQMTKVFSLQTVFASGGAMLAAFMPWIMIHVFGFSDNVTGNTIPFSIKLSFYIGASAFLFFVCWTVFTTKEEPPADMEQFLEEKKNHGSFVDFMKELGKELVHMPPVIKQFWAPQFFLWFGYFCMWVYFGLGIAQNVYGLPAGAVIKDHPLFSQELMEGTAWCGICFATYQCVSFLFAFFLPSVAKKMGPKAAYGLSLACGGAGLMGAMFVHNAFLLILCMVGVGISWGGVMTMPYSIIAQEIPKKQLGIYMGLFNMTITIPQIVCALVLSFIAARVFHNNAMEIVFFGGCMMIVASLLMFRLQRKDNKTKTV